jgi:hypothetical protein
MTNEARMIEHIVESAKTNPRMARGLRELLVKALGNHQEGSEVHSSLLETINSLDTYIAAEGDGYSKEPVMRGTQCSS